MDVDAEAPAPGRYDVHASERQALHFADIRGTSHIKRHGNLIPDLGAAPDQHDAKWLIHRRYSWLISDL